MFPGGLEDIDGSVLVARQSLEGINLLSLAA